tara:strand:+ start:3011 stop:3799 length:789 start_codon:yes stop_codon:yes gene_type:complete
MRAILLAGGYGKRLNPATKGTNKHLLLVYDKPMFFYPLSLLILLGIKEILIISDRETVPKFKKILKGITFLNRNINIQYEIQNNANGIPEAFIIGEKFINKSKKNILILGDNFFYSNKFVSEIKKYLSEPFGSQIFLYKVKDPKNFGTVNFDKKKNKIRSLSEKPKKPSNNFAITGLYFFDHKVCNFAKKLKKSKRGELEILSLLNIYLKKKQLKFRVLERGYTWFDLGTFENLLNAQNFVKIIQERQGLEIGNISIDKYTK